MKSNRQFEAFPLLETTHLVLRELQPEDAEAVFQFTSDIEVMRYYDPPMTQLEEARSAINRHHMRFEKNEAIRWGITLKGAKQVVGNCGFFLDTANMNATLSYVLARSWWNKGMMTEALKAIISFGFNECHLHRIEAYAALKNTASLRVLQKLEFQQEGVLRERFYENGQFHDELLFSLLPKDLA